MGPISSPKTSVRNYLCLLHNNPEKCSSLAVSLLVKIVQVSKSKHSRDFILLSDHVIFTFLIATEQFQEVFIKFQVTIYKCLLSFKVVVFVTECDVMWFGRNVLSVQRSVLPLSSG
jgi:hypothetical protein